MAKFRKRSRVSKALTDAGKAGSFSEAEARLNAIHTDVVIGPDQLSTSAGQAAALTAIATARKCFGRVTLITAEDAPLLAPLPIGRTLLKAARRLGAKIAAAPSKNATHTIRIGTTARGSGWNIRCWWNRWLSGTRGFGDDAVGDSRLALSGVFSAALAVRQVFACVLAGKDIIARDATVSLWTPWEPANGTQIGPVRFDVPDKIWFLGLGHLGQAFVWNLCLLRTHGKRLAVLQDDQDVGEENEATSLLVLPGDGEIGERKTRVAAPWLEFSGWKTELIERRHHADVALQEHDPPYLLCGLDRLPPRLRLAKHGFPYMLDAGIGHGPGDFEGIQLRTIAQGQSIEGLWSPPGANENTGPNRLLNRPAYKELEAHVGECGKYEFADASVAVPFVGAATGALAIAQLIRLACMEAAPRFLQVELSAPEMATLGGLAPAPELNLGSHSVGL